MSAQPDTFGRALDQASRRLAAAGLPSARLDARLLVAHAAGTRAEAVMGYPERPLEAPAAETLAALVVRRIERVPMAHLLGRREFWSLTFRVTDDTLDPRPDSETVVAAVLDQVGDRGLPLRVLDLGTGTGCLLLALLSELPNANGIGVDASPAALAVARENAETLGFADRAAFALGNWGSVLSGPYDVIVANPPYIPRGSIDRLEPEVALYEPRLALDGGEDGLAAYRALLPDVGRLIEEGGVVGLEIGEGQGAAVAALCRQESLVVGEIRRDLGGIERCLVARR